MGREVLYRGLSGKGRLVEWRTGEVELGSVAKQEEVHSVLVEAGPKSCLL